MKTKIYKCVCCKKNIKVNRISGFMDSQEGVCINGCGSRFGWLCLKCAKEVFKEVYKRVNINRIIRGCVLR